MLIDFAPGAAMMGKTALLMGCKVILVCHNEAHKELVVTILKEYLLNLIKNDTAPFANTKEQRLQDAKSPRFLKLEKQIAEQKGLKRPSEQQNSPAEKRAKMATSWKGVLEGFTITIVVVIVISIAIIIILTTGCPVRCNCISSILCSSSLLFCAVMFCVVMFLSSVLCCGVCSWLLCSILLKP